MMDPTIFPRNLISDSPIDESAKSKFTTVSPETREAAAKTIATSMFLPLFPKIGEATVGIVPNMISSNLHRSPVCGHWRSIQRVDLPCTLKVGTEVIVGNDTGICTCCRISGSCNDELELKTKYIRKSRKFLHVWQPTKSISVKRRVSQSPSR